MAQYLRVVRKARWLTHPEILWLPENTNQADALLDLKPDSNRLSLWLVDDNGGTLERVASAIASKRDDLVVLDYALIDTPHVDEIGVASEKSRGATLDEEANAQWHRDLIELTVASVCELAEAIRGKGKVDRIPWKKLGAWLNECIAEGQIDPERLSPKVREKLEKII